MNPESPYFFKAVKIDRTNFLQTKIAARKCWNSIVFFYKNTHFICFTSIWQLSSLIHIIHISFIFKTIDSNNNEDSDRQSMIVLPHFDEVKLAKTGGQARNAAGAVCLPIIFHIFEVNFFKNENDFWYLICELYIFVFFEREVKCSNEDTQRICFVLDTFVINVVRAIIFSWFVSFANIVE